MSMLILYGSETGTSQDVAESLAREAILHKIDARVRGFDEYDIEMLPSEKYVLFVISTTGQGEIPPNARSAWRLLLRRSLSSTWLDEVPVAVFGLGDSSYQKYNFASKKLYRRLLQLGADMITDLGLGDDQHEIGIDGGLIPFRDALWKEIWERKIFEKMTPDPDSTIVFPPKYRLAVNGEMKAVNDHQDYFELIVDENRRLTADDHFQDTRHIRFSIPSELQKEFSYSAGDVLMVLPENLDETVSVAIDALGYSQQVLDSPIYLIPNSQHTKNLPSWLIGAPTTIRTCLRRLFDLQQSPRRSFFEVLAGLSTDDAEKDRLTELGSPNGLDDLLDYCTRCKRTIAETIRDFPATAKNIPPERLFDFLPFIRPRAFSIASPPSHELIELLVAKVEYKTRMADKRRGLCSSYISRLRIGDKVFAKIRKGTFKFPSAHSTPVVCVGPGTGVAPFRSYLVHQNSKAETRTSILFFGCRGQTRDFYYEDEWPLLKSVKFIPAFSRDTEKKIYVQDKIAEHAHLVWDLLHRGDCYVFVAGSAGDMPKAVAAEIDRIAKERGDPEWVQRTEAAGRLQYETWS